VFLPQKEHFRKPPLRVTNDGSVPRRFYASALDSGRCRHEQGTCGTARD
jgi:hypothetical protein